MARSSPGMGSKLTNGAALSKLPFQTPSSKVPHKATHEATLLGWDTGQRPKKPQTPGMPRTGFHATSTVCGARAGLPPRGSDCEKPPTSSQLPKSSQEPGGCGAVAGTLKKNCWGSTVGQLAKDTHGAKSSSSSFCTSQGRDCGTHLPAGPGTKLAVPKDSDLAAPRSSGTAPVEPSPLGSTALQWGSTTAALLAGKPELSAKKVSLSFCPETPAHTSCLLSRLCGAPADRGGWAEPPAPDPGCGAAPPSLGQALLLSSSLSDAGDGCCPRAWHTGVAVPVPAEQGALAPSWCHLSPGPVAGSGGTQEGVGQPPPQAVRGLWRVHWGSRSLHFSPSLFPLFS